MRSPILPEDVLGSARAGRVSVVVLESALALAHDGRILRHLVEELTPVICTASRGARAAPLLDLGADDVLSEPVGAAELVARVKAVLRGYQRASETERVLRVGPIEVDPVNRNVRVRGRRVELTRAELDVLHALAGSPGKVFHRDELVERCVDAETIVTSRVIDTHVVGLRRKLGAASRWIETVRGYGYRVRSEDEAR